MKTILIAAAISLCATLGHAATIFQNTAVTTGDANCQFECTANTVGAENFNMGRDGSLTEITFDVLHSKGTDLTGATVTWGLHQFDSGLPGAAFLSDTDALQFVVQGDFDTVYRELRISIDMNGLELERGDYWLSLSLDVVGETASLFWRAAADGDALSAISADAGTSWSTPYGTFQKGAAFAINGTLAPVPLPAGLPLMLVGVGALAMLRRAPSTYAKP